MYKNKRLISIFFLGSLLLNYPMLSLFNMKKNLFGLPLLYGYIFAVWSILVLFISMITRKPKN